MAKQAFHLRLVGPIAWTSLLLLALCVSVAVYLYGLQANTAEALGENIGSRRAAADLEESLLDLVALHRNAVQQVAPLHERVEAHLANIRRYADKPEEKKLVDRLTSSFEHYRQTWEALPEESPAERAQNVVRAQDILVKETLPSCQKLRRFNTMQIEQSEQIHRKTLRWMAWGLAGVGVIGALAGLLLGYAVARGVQRSLHRLQIHIQDAADKLGQDLPTVVLSEEGGLEGLHEQMQGVVRQIEEVVQRLQQREHEVLRAEQLAAVGQLAAGVAHEIRNPLTSIKMLVQTGREEAEARGMPAEDLQVIEREIRRMERSLKTFLEFARPPKPRRVSLDLTELVEQTLNLIRGRAAKQHVTLGFTPPAAPVEIEADAEQLHQVLVNLTLNALDAMPQGGLLEVDLQKLAEEQVELRIRDSGPGISPELMARLFQPFVSTKETGVGLGLVVSRRIVEAHGGSLRACNDPEGGACFVVLLPTVVPVVSQAV